MAWSATKLSVTKSGGNVVAKVRFAESVTGDNFTQDIPAQDLSEFSLATFCQRVIVGLEARDAAFAKITPTGPVILPRDASDPDVIAAVAAAAAADAFFVLYAAYNNLLAQAAKGIIKPDDPAIAAAADAMKAAFLPEYAKDPRFK